ncbi:dUTPase [Lysinibacillus sp. BF-4]|uniref:dUTP diphosphatase n=1 Tax=Lysinibacillus sp. BF-4 TaxID=1473546 RepID=UPI00050112A2|nr:dUTP diphosphatase [Lysinibacillus sp. BF-4]KFL44138.1 dUTPase [Lysinibacillus sp. BF-4]
MNLQKLFEMQAALDAFIEKTQNITHDVFREKGLALLVELGELANETRCFKFWSTKGPSAREVILEEFVDSIHFMLSLGIMRELAFEEWQITEQSHNLTELFLRAQADIITFLNSPTENTYTAIWDSYALLAYNLGFTPEDIVRAYIAKNEENYARQRSGY